MIINLDMRHTRGGREGEGEDGGGGWGGRRDFGLAFHPHIRSWNKRKREMILTVMRKYLFSLSPTVFFFSN